MDKEKERVAGIRIEDSTNVRVDRNISSGYEEGIVAKGVDGLSAADNLAIATPSKPSGRAKWIREHLVSLLITVFGGLIVAFLAFRFGWL